MSSKQKECARNSSCLPTASISQKLNRRAQYVCVRRVSHKTRILVLFALIKCQPRRSALRPKQRRLTVPLACGQSLQLLRNAGVIAAARAVLRGEDTDAAAVAQLVNLVEQVDD